MVRGLKSSDVSCQEEALENADQLIASLELKEACTSKINKSVTNTNPSSEIRPLVRITILYICVNHVLTLLFSILL